MSPNAVIVLRSALVAGLLAAISVILNDITNVIDVDFAGGLGITIVVVVLKYLQKYLSERNCNCKHV